MSNNANFPDKSFSDMIERLARIEKAVSRLLIQNCDKEWYTIAEIANEVGKQKFTVREWCRLGRMEAKKRATGRGLSQEWMVSHAELQRYRNEGLREDPFKYRHVG
jgi:hypothetical protein